MDKRWGLNIDIEGFSNLYESNYDNQSKAILGLRELMHSIIQIGINVYPGDPNINESDRIFAHQFGDGFIIVSDFEETDAGRCIAIATALMRHMLLKGYATKVAISTGGMSGINGCYPDEMRNSQDGRLQLGAGLMTSIPVMGTALTKAHKLASKVSGNVLVVDNMQFSIIPTERVTKTASNISFVNWQSDENELAKYISQKANLAFGAEDQLKEKFENYIKTEPCPPQRWIEGSRLGNDT
ncbi:MAG: hypothetical protein OEY36_06310 [Gammaproteobacteria bacterium]|nr:hypothetical protein [Gammaproteobacteria bacterium]